MSPLSSPPIAQSRIPKVKELYESLGFGSAFKRPTADLAESTHSWRKGYITHDSIPGRDLRDWKLLSTRNDLEQMAAEFVKDGRGEKHWPLKGCESPRLIPEYPLDKYKIIGLLQQLFWRQNVNAAHNANSSDQAQGRESASSDRTSASLSQNAATNHHTRLFDASEERNKILQLHARALPDGTQPLHRDTNVIGNAIESLSQRTAEPSVRQRSSLSDTHSKWGIHSESTPNDVSERPKQPAQPIGAAKYSARSSASEDIYTYRGSDGERGQSKRESSKIVKLKYYKQSTKKAIADHIGKKSTIDAKETPLTARGIAPKAVMIPLSAKVTVTPTRRLPERRNSPGKSGSFTESRGPKRKNLHDDDEAEYSPRKATVRKKFPSQKLRDSIAKARPVRDGLHLKLHNKDSPVVMTGVQRGAKLPSILAGQRDNSPISISDGGNESDEPVSPPAAAGQDVRQRSDRDLSPASTEDGGRKRAEQIRKPVPTSTSPDCQTLGAPSARNSQDSPGRAPKMSALMGSFRVLHADPFRPMLPVPHTDTMAPVETIREADLYPVSTSDPEAEKTQQVSTTITDASNGTCGTQRATSTFSPPRQAGTDMSPGTSDARPLTLDGMVKPQSSTTPTLNTQEQASTSEPFLNSDAQQKGRADVSQSPADSKSNTPKQITMVEAAQANGTPASELAKSDKGHPALTSNRDSPKPGTSDLLNQYLHNPSPVLEEAEEPRHLPASSLGPPSEPMGLQKLPIECTPTASSKEDGNIHLSLAMKTSVPKLSHQDSKVHLPITTGKSVPEPPKEAQSHPPATSYIDIGYFIIMSQIPRPVKQRWDIQSLSGKSVGSLFEEVSHFISKPDVQRIDFKLRLAQADSKSSIKCNDSKAFENMKKDFADDIMADVKDKGNTNFTIWLEPDPIQQDSQLEVRGSSMGEGCPRISI